MEHTLRSHHKKPAGTVGYDFRGRNFLKMDSNCYVPEQKLTRWGVTIPLSDYIVRSLSIAVMLANDAVMGGQEDQFWYLLVTSSLHSSCAHEGAPVRGKWMQLQSDEDCTFKTFPTQLDFINIRLQHIISIGDALLTFDARQVGPVWEIQDKIDFQQKVKELRETVNSSQWREQPDSSATVEEVISSCSSVVAVYKPQ